MAEKSPSAEGEIDAREASWRNIREILLGHHRAVSSMEIINQEYELVPVDALKPHPRNPRESDTVAIAERIIHNGFYGAVVAQKSTGFILAGLRLKAAVDTGATEVPVIWVEADDEQALRILLADNRTNDLAGYDEKVLAEVLKSLESIEGTGYDQAAVDEIIASVEGGGRSLRRRSGSEG